MNQLEDLVFRNKIRNMVKTNVTTGNDQSKSLLSITENTNKNTYVPITESLQDSIPATTNGIPSKHPAASYISSAYTFLGILLWLLYDSKMKQ